MKLFTVGTRRFEHLYVFSKPCENDSMYDHAIRSFEL